MAPLSFDSHCNNFSHGWRIFRPTYFKITSICSCRKVDTRVFYLQPKTIIMTFVLLWYYIVMCWTVAWAVNTFKAMESSAIKRFLELIPKPLTKCVRVSWQFIFLSKVSYSKLTFLTRNSLFLLETHFSYSKLAFLTRNSLFLLETRFSYSKLAFLTRNSLFLLETHFSREHSIW